MLNYFENDAQFIGTTLFYLTNLSEYGKLSFYTSLYSVNYTL